MGSATSQPVTLSPNPETRSSCAQWVSRWSTGAAFVFLAGVNLVLFLQLQAVTYQVGRNTHQMQELREALADESSKTKEISNQIQHSLAQQMAGGFVLLTMLIATFHITAHLRSFEQPDVQRKIVAILFLPPIYAVCSFVSLSLPAAQEYMMIIKDFYEAYCIYQFLSFLIAVLGKGSRVVVVKVLEKHSSHMPGPYRCWGAWLGNPPQNDNPRSKSQAVLLECQILAMQFVFVKPLTAVATFVSRVVEDSKEADAANEIGDEDAETSASDYLYSSWAFLLSARCWILVIQNVSVALAFAGLLKFYHIVRDDLLWCQPFAKFLCIKGVVFMTFWQGIVIAILLYFFGEEQKERPGASEASTSTKLQNLLICVEMLMFSLFHFCVFPVDEWADGYRPKVMGKPGIALGDFVDDLNWVVGQTSTNLSESLHQRKPVAALPTKDAGDLESEQTRLLKSSQP